MAAIRLDRPRGAVPVARGRAGRFRRDLREAGGNDFDGWAVVEWECPLKHPEDGAREGAAVRPRPHHPGDRQGLRRLRRRRHRQGRQPAASGTGGLSDGLIAPNSLGADPAGDGGRRRGRLHRRGAPDGGAARRGVRPRRRGAFGSRPSARGPRAGRWGWPRTASTTISRPWPRRRRRATDGIEAVAIVTPNHMHARPAWAFLEARHPRDLRQAAGRTADEARAIAEAAARSDALFVLTHNYTGYPMVRAAREMVAAGALGPVRVVQVEYAQDWLAEPVANKQADWRTDPARSGPAGRSAISAPTPSTSRNSSPACGRGAGGRAFQLRAGPAGGRQRPCDAAASNEGARGQLWASQVAVGNENGLRLRVHGAKGGLEWDQEAPDRLWFTPFGQPEAPPHPRRCRARGRIGRG
jgi:hypothetical protein